MSKAVELFLAVPRRHNCAQAVAAGCGRDALHESLEDSSGGRAPNGLCGAVYAAMLLVPDRKKEILKEFAEMTGSAICVELKKERRVPCTECVRLGAELAAKYGDA